MVINIDEEKVKRDVLLFLQRAHKERHLRSNMCKWNSWQEISVVEKYHALYRWPGMYQMRLIDDKGKPISISRFLDSDIQGLLVIGESNNVARRLNQFYKALNRVSFKHSTAERMFLVRFMTPFQKAFTRIVEYSFAV